MHNDSYAQESSVRSWAVFMG